MTNYKIIKYLQRLSLRDKLDIYFFYLFLISAFFNIRKVIFYFPIQDQFNEYTGIYLYLSDIFLLLTIISWVIICNKKYVLSRSIRPSRGQFFYNKIQKLFHVEQLVEKNYELRFKNKDKKECSTWNILRRVSKIKNVPRGTFEYICQKKILLIPLLLVIWAFISIIWAENKIIAFYQSIKLLEFYLLYVYINLRFRDIIAVFLKMFHVEHFQKNYDEKSRGVKPRCGHATFRGGLVALRDLRIKNKEYKECSTWNNNDIEIINPKSKIINKNVPRGTFCIIAIIGIQVLALILTISKSAILGLFIGIIWFYQKMFHVEQYKNVPGIRRVSGECQTKCKTLYLLSGRQNVPRGTFFYNDKNLKNKMFHVEHLENTIYLFHIIFFVFLFIMFFDHYLWDIQVGKIMFWLILSILSIIMSNVPRGTFIKSKYKNQNACPKCNHCRRAKCSTWNIFKLITENIILRFQNRILLIFYNLLTNVPRGTLVNHKYKCSTWNISGSFIKNIGKLVLNSIIYLVKGFKKLFYKMFHVEHLPRQAGLLLIIIFIFLAISLFISLDIDSFLLQSLKERVFYLNVSRGTFFNDPILGIGNGQFIWNMQKIEDILIWQFQPVHNVYLLILNELGIIGFLIFIYWLYGMFHVEHFNFRFHISDLRTKNKGQCIDKNNNLFYNTENIKIISQNSQVNHSLSTTLLNKKKCARSCIEYNNKTSDITEDEIGNWKLENKENREDSSLNKIRVINTNNKGDEKYKLDEPAKAENINIEANQENNNYYESKKNYSGTDSLFLSKKEHKSHLLFLDILKVIIFLGVINSIVAISQVVLQKSIGLQWLGESILAPDIPGVAKIILGGEKYIRAYGFFPHPNILGGFLVMSLIFTWIYCFYLKKYYA